MHVQHMGRTFEANKGDVVLIDCNNPHYYQAENGLEFTFIHFDGSNSHEIVEHILEIRGPLIRSKNNALIGSFIYDTVNFTKTEDTKVCSQPLCGFINCCSFFMIWMIIRLRKKTPSIWLSITLKIILEKNHAERTLRNCQYERLLLFPPFQRGNRVFTHGLRYQHPPGKSENAPGTNHQNRRGNRL